MIQDTLEEKTGYRHHMKDPTFKAQFFRHLKDTTGFSNPGANPAVIANRQEAYFLKTGYTNPGANPKVIAKRQKTYFLKTGYKQPWKNPEVRAKAKRTLIARTGFDNPLANPETFAKAMASQHRIKEGIYAGRVYQYQGWENTVFERLADLYGVSSVLTQFDDAFPSCWKNTGTKPDLFVIPKNIWIEVKSTYTLYGTKYQDTLYKNKLKARAQVEAGVKVTWVVVLNPKRKSYVVLPKNWYTLGRKALTRYVKDQDTGTKADSEAELTRQFGPRKDVSHFKKLTVMYTPVTTEAAAIFQYKGRAIVGVIMKASGKFRYTFKTPQFEWNFKAWPEGAIFFDESTQ